MQALELMIREAYAAFGRGDLDGYLRACTDDFSFHVPGASALAGNYVGRPGIQELARKAMEITAGTFQEEVEDVLANDRHAVVLARHRFLRDGAPREYLTAHVYDVAGGKLARCFEQPRNLSAFEDAWGASSTAAKPAAS
jgi:ketosteroid isomerase-like protein